MSDDAARRPRLESFLWNSVSHLEARIEALDQKANFMIGLVTGAAAAIGALGRDAVAHGTWNTWRVVASVALAADGAFVGAIILGCLRIIRPGSHAKVVAAAGAEWLELPETYVVWPSRGLGRTPSDHAAALRDLDEEALVENLVYMQTTLIHLVNRKMDSYRRAVDRTRTFVYAQGAVLALLFATIAAR